MELKLISEEERISKVATQGRITQESIQPDVDLLLELLGDDAYQGTILLDLSRSDYMDSSGVSWLLERHKRCRESGGRLVIHSVAPTIQHILKILRMDRVFHLADTEADALHIAQEDSDS